MGARRYYTLIASLPYLPYFEQAGRLPINAPCLQKRRTLLAPDDEAELTRLLALLRWQAHPVTQTDAHIVRQYKMVIEMTSSRQLRDFVEFRMGMRTVMAALRKRRRGEGPPEAAQAFGAGLGIPRLAAGWDDPDFKLRPLHPWLPEARSLLEADDAVGLERLLMNIMWQRLSRMSESDMFGFPAVVAYAFKWDILDRWLAQDAEAATTVFRNLVSEVTREHQQAIEE